MAWLAAPQLDWAPARMVAGVLLCVYAVVAVLQYGRESRFLSDVPLAQRAWFIAQDLLIQLGVLLSLLPVALAAQPSRPVLYASLIGITILWLAGIWTVFSRRVYTYRLLLGARDEHDKLLRSILEAKGKRGSEGKTSGGADE